FERLGYFWRDPVDSRPGALVFNRTVTLRDTWAKRSAEERQPAGGAAGAKAPQPAKPPKPPKTERVGDAAPAEPARSAALEARRARYRDELGVGDVEAEIVTRDEATANLFE